MARPEFMIVMSSGCVQSGETLLTVQLAVHS